MSTINIALTSYPKRITNCVAVINSVLENTVLPDRIYLTLSHLEFPNWEEDLPKDLYKLIMTSNRVILNWVEENTKSMKKVFPILQYLEDDDIIIDIDDDMRLPRDFIESRINDFHANNDEHPITSNLCQSINLDNMVMSCYSLFQKRMLAHWETFVTDRVLNTFNDDRTYLYLCHMNGYKLKPCTKYCVGKSNGIVQPLQLNPHQGYMYLIGPRYDEHVAQVVANLSAGLKICDCFGLFLRDEFNNKPVEHVQSKSGDDKEFQEFKGTDAAKLFQYNLDNVRHDIVYVLGKGSKYNNLEIKISITSMLKFCDHWLGNIYIVGENPGIRNPRVKHLYVPDITKSNKDANIIHKLLTAIQKIPSLTENFLFCSDDILVTKRTDWEDFTPRYVFEYKQDDASRRDLFEKSRSNPWDKLLLQTLDRFLGIRDHIYFYEPHIFAPINKRYFRQMCHQIDYTNSKSVIIMSLWFNWLNINHPLKRCDHQSVFSTNIPDLTSPARHFTYNDKAFSVKRFRDWLINRVTIEGLK